MKRNTITYQSGLLVLKHQSADPENFELRIIGKLSTDGQMEHSGDLTVGGNLTVNGVTSMEDDLTVRGNLFVKGDTVKVDSQISTADRIIILNDGEVGNGVTGGFSGINIDRGSSSTYEFGFNEQTKSFELGKEGSRQPVATRHPNPTNQALLVWNSSNNRLESTTANSARNWLGVIEGGTGSNQIRTNQQIASLYYNRSQIDDMISNVSDGTVTSVSGDGNSSLILTMEDGSSISTNLQHTHSNISLSAGNGLTGGGNLGSNRTITLGTPSTVGSGSTNSVSGSSHTHEIQLNSDDIPSLDWTNKISGKPVGLEGQVYFFDSDGTDITNGYTMVSGRFVSNEEQLIEEQQNTPSFADIFSRWNRFSHGSNTGGHAVRSFIMPANPNSTNSWTYDESTDQIFSTENSPSYIGFTSERVYDNYTHSLRMAASGSDNDGILVVIAYYEDPDDLVPNNAFGLNPDNFSWDINVTDEFIPKQYTLSLLRTRTRQSLTSVDGTNSQYAIVYNYKQPDEKIIADGDQYVENTTAGFGNNTGCHVKVQRLGDSIQVWTTDWEDLSSYDGQFVESLSANLTDDPVLDKFRGPRSYGYGAHSQDSSTFTEIEFMDPSGRIYDLENNVSYTYDGNQWNQQPESVRDEIGIGRFLYSESFKTLSYTAPDGNITVPTQPTRLRAGLLSDFIEGDATLISGPGTNLSQQGSNITISVDPEFGGVDYVAGGGLRLTGSTFSIDAGNGIIQDTNGISFDSQWADGIYARLMQKPTSNINDSDGFGSFRAGSQSSSPMGQFPTVISGVDKSVSNDSGVGIQIGTDLRENGSPLRWRRYYQGQWHNAKTVWDNENLPSPASSDININVGSGLTGGGSLSSDVNIGLDSTVAIFGTTNTTVRNNQQLDARYSTTDTVTRMRGTASGTYRTGDITLAASGGTTITQSGGTITISSVIPDGGTDTVTRLRGTTSGTFQSGDITLAASGATSISQSGNTITISSTDTNTNTVTRLRGTTSGTFQSGDITLAASGATSISQSGNTITISSTNTNTTYGAGTGISLSSGNFSVTNIASGSSSSGALRYNGTTRSDGRLYGGTSAPNGTTRLNYSGYLYATRFYTPSSIELKNITEVIEPSESYNNVISLGKNGVRIGHYKDDETKSETRWMIAEEIDQVMPEAVSKDEDGNISSVNYDQLIPELYAAFYHQNEVIKELRKKIDDLSKR